MTRCHRMLFGMIAVTVIACDRRPQVAGVDTAVPKPTPDQAHGVFLSVSSLTPRPGDTVVVAATVASRDSIAPGSFRVRLSFDSARMSFAGEDVLPGMRVVNPARDAIIVAGVSSERRLFALRFRVDDASALQSLLLRVDELNDTSFSNRAPSVERTSELILDQSLGGSAPAASIQREAKQTRVVLAPVIDSIRPRSEEVGPDRVTDIVIYGRGFAPSGNVVSFGEAQVEGLLSEFGGTVIRFAAPASYPARGTLASRRVGPGAVSIRVRNPAGASNAATFRVRAER